jgi:cytochrome c
VRRVDVSTDGGRSWRTARLQEPVMAKCLTRFSLDWQWDGKPALIQSRAVDETGYVQPTYRQLRAVRGTRSIYHNNACRPGSWRRAGRCAMCSSRSGRWVVGAVLALAAVGAAAQAARAAAPGSYPGIGRPATAKELAAWDIDVRADFKGLPAGSGSVARGMEVWEAKCASCHGVFGESNEVFQPIVGGTTAADIRTGRVAALADNSYPGRTTLMKLTSVSTLWDYIRRAMPWNAPKSLTIEEVYASTAYILHLGGIVPESFVLSDRNMAEVQRLLPNRHGGTRAHALWPGAGRAKPDVQARACMVDCDTEPKVASLLPAHARGAHGNLAEQNRGFGSQRGADTRPAGAPASTLAAAPSAPSGEASALALAGRNGCTACHGLDNRIVGPSFREVAAKHASRADAVAYLALKAKAGGGGVWGSIPMPPQAIAEADAEAIARWLAAGAKP